MNFASKETHESTSHPGVKFTVRRLNQIQRAKRDLKIVEHNVKFSQLFRQLANTPMKTAEYIELEARVNAAKNTYPEFAEFAVQLKILPSTTPEYRELEAKVNEAENKYPEIAELVKKLKTLPMTTPEYDAVDHEVGLVWNIHLKPAAIRAGLLAVEGMLIDDQAITADSLLESGPEDLIEEVYTACEAACRLSAEQQKNLSSPSDSLVPGVGTESSMTAKPVNGLDTSGIAIAGASSPTL